MELVKEQAKVSEAVWAWDEREDHHPDSCLCGAYKMASIITRTP
jgi:hypothetical protein